MGWFGREPRKVGFSSPRKPPTPERKPATQPARPPQPAPEPVRTDTVARTFATSTTGSEQSADDRAAAYASDQQREVMDQIAKVKKHSPWLGGLLKKAAAAQMQGQGAQPGQTAPYTPPNPHKPKRRLLIIALILFFLLGPIISSLTMLFAQ